MRFNNIAVSLIAITLIILLLIIGMILVIMLARRQKIKQELNEALYQNKLNETAMASLRAQMNPHFIFNCLNSIKLYTEQNNSAAASEYLSKFSKLIRNMLDNARSDNSLLANEIETLQLYIDMETMRFKDKLQCSISIAQDVDLDFIEVPPLLIQPYVENAIWHGIMPKAEGGQVWINISQNHATNDLEISIKDNGIGREKSAALKKGKSQLHQSHGTAITHNRLDLLNEKNKASASVVISDVLDENHLVSGTLVTLKLKV